MQANNLKTSSRTPPSRPSRAHWPLRPQTQTCGRWLTWCSTRLPATTSWMASTTRPSPSARLPGRYAVCCPRLYIQESGNSQDVALPTRRAEPCRRCAATSYNCASSVTANRRRWSKWSTTTTNRPRSSSLSAKWTTTTVPPPRLAGWPYAEAPTLFELHASESNLAVLPGRLQIPWSVF